MLLANDVRRTRTVLLCCTSLLAALLLAVTTAAPVSAASPSSSNYALPLSTVAAGLDTMTSANYRLSSTLGATSGTLPANSASYLLYPGFWHGYFGLAKSCVLDVDGDQTLTALGDGLIILRAMLGLTGTAATAAATATGAPRQSWEQIQPFIHLAALDIDADGSTSAAADGVMLLRALFGYTGGAVTAGSGSGKTWSELRAYLNTQCGATFPP